MMYFVVLCNVSWHDIDVSVNALCYYCASLCRMFLTDSARRSWRKASIMHWVSVLQKCPLLRCELFCCFILRSVPYIFLERMLLVGRQEMRLASKNLLQQCPEVLPWRSSLTWIFMPPHDIVWLEASYFCPVHPWVSPPIRVCVPRHC